LVQREGLHLRIAQAIGTQHHGHGVAEQRGVREHVHGHIGTREGWYVRRQTWAAIVGKEKPALHGGSCQAG
jgi:hypothetical protein